MSETFSSSPRNGDIRVVDKLNLDDDVIMAAPCTPMLPDGEVNFERFEPYVNQMVKTGISGLFVNGTLGEGMSLTNAERKESLEKWCSLKRDRFKSIIVHCGAGGIKDTIELVKHAASVSGVDAIAVMCPTLFKPTCIANLVRYLTEIAQHAPNTPFLYYDINVLTNVVFDTAEVVRQCKASIPTFSGIKYSCRELGNYDAALMECENGRYKMAVGTVDEEWLPWLPFGAQVPICHSIMGSIHKKTKAAFLAGDMKTAAESQRLAQKVGVVKRRFGPDIPVSKAIVKMMGLDLGPVRLPLEELTPQAYGQLQQDLKTIGFL